MSSPSMRSAAGIRRKTPLRYPSHAGDPALAAPLGALRDALTLADLWRAVVALLDAALPNHHYVAALPCVEDRPIYVNSTVPAAREPGYWDRFISCEPPLARVIAAQPGIGLSFLHDHWAEEALTATPFYRAIMEPEGWWDAAGFLFWDGAVFTGHIGLNRTRAQGPYLAHERQLLEDLRLPIESAVRRVAAFDSERAKRAALEEVLKQLPDGMVILDWELRPVFGNRAAEDSCRLWNEGGSGGGALPDDVRAMAGSLLTGSETLLRQPPPGRLGAPFAELAHPRIEGLRARLRLLRPKEKQTIKPHCLIEFSRVTERPDGRAIASFSLSTAERRVADLVARGRSNPATAAELHLSIHTVRAHLREIFLKLNIQRRSELAAALRKAP